MAHRELFAEYFVAGLLADAGWNLYFPRQDRGLDFIATKTQKNGHELIRPIQVKGKFPTSEKGDKTLYGYVGALTQLHPEMVLAIPYFRTNTPGPAHCTAFMPFSRLRPHSRGWRCEPAGIRGGIPKPRRDFVHFFDTPGIRALELVEWSQT